MRKNKIIVACDSFKGACTSLDAGNAIKRGVLKRLSSSSLDSVCNLSDNVVVFSLGDGGEGTASALASSLGYEIKQLSVSDTHGIPTSADYYLSRDNSVAVFDMSACSGIALAQKHGLDIMNASTSGVGQLIKYLAESGTHDITVCLGGSGTSDGGVGALSELGVKFYDYSGQLLKDRLCPKNLDLIKCADTEPALKLLEGIKLTLLYDSAIPLSGEHGSVMMYSRQKGADDITIPILETNIKHLSQVLNGSHHNLSDAHGAGAAGGLGFGLSVIGGILTSGADRVLDLVGFDSYLSDAAVIITGEGKTDKQSSTGKLPSAIAGRAARFDIPVICLCGVNDADSTVYDCGITSVIQIGDKPMPMADSIADTLPMLEKTAFDLAGLFTYFK